MRYLFSLLLSISILSAETVEELKSRVCNALPTIYGWASQEKAIAFMDLVLEVKPNLCVEIGVFGGRSILPVAAALKFLDRGMVIAIDPWSREEVLPYFDPIRDKAHIDWWSKINFDHIYYSYLNLLSQFNIENYVVTLRTTSTLASPAIGDIDILYIDGNHNEQIALRDVELYLPKVRPGGYIWLDDSLWANLQLALELLSKNCDFVKLIDQGNCILFRKK